MFRQLPAGNDSISDGGVSHISTNDGGVSHTSTSLASLRQ
jgi:hypothetical protein